MELKDVREWCDNYTKPNSTTDGGNLLYALEWLMGRVENLFETIKHGDEKHQAWLKEAIDKHFGKAR